MDDGVKGARAPKKATAPEETGQKAAELLLAVLEELKASRAESEALRKLLAQVLTALARPEEAEEDFAQKAFEGQARQEGSAKPSAPRKLNRSPVPVAIEFVDMTRNDGQEKRRDQE